MNGNLPSSESFQVHFNEGGGIVDQAVDREHHARSPARYLDEFADELISNKFSNILAVPTPELRDSIKKALMEKQWWRRRSRFRLV